MNIILLYHYAGSPEMCENESKVLSECYLSCFPPIS